MRIEVIEGGRADGTDLVVGEHLENPLAQAKRSGQRIVQVVELGGDFGLAGVSIVPMLAADAADTLCLNLVVAAGPTSKLVGIQPVPVVLAELARIPVSKLREKLAAALKPEQAA